MDMHRFRSARTVLLHQYPRSPVGAKAIFFYRMRADIRGSGELAARRRMVPADSAGFSRQIGMTGSAILAGRACGNTISFI
jgi:hypothetical protein